MSEDMWKTVVGYPNYQVSETGKVRSNKVGLWRLLKPSVSHYGYLVVNLTDVDGIKKQLKVHRLVCQAFNGEQPIDKPFVNHKSGVKLNNFFKNLEWSTQPENNQHAVVTGLNKKASDFQVIVHNETLGTSSQVKLHADILQRFGLKPHVLEMMLRYYPHRRLWFEEQQYSFEPVFDDEQQNDFSQTVNVLDVKTGESFTAPSQRIAAIRTGLSRFSIYRSLKTGKPSAGYLFQTPLP